MENRDFVLPLFSIPLGIYFNSNNNYNNAELINYIKNSSNNYNVHNTNTERNDILDDNLCVNLRSYILSCLNRYATELMLYPSDILDITISWGNLTKPGQSHHSHCHFNSIFSGVYYLNDCTEAPITFQNPNLSYKFISAGDENNTNHFTSMEWNVPMEKDSLVIFPSWLIHKVNINNSNRINISFNTWFKKGVTIGNDSAKTKLTF